MWSKSARRVKICFGSIQIELCEHILMCLAICFQRHKEYIKMLKERKEALGELKAKSAAAHFPDIVIHENMCLLFFYFPLTWPIFPEAAEDDLEDAITSTTESVQYDHPNHTVTVTTISDLDLTGAHLLTTDNQVSLCHFIYTLRKNDTGDHKNCINTENLCF